MIGAVAPLPCALSGRAQGQLYHLLVLYHIGVFAVNSNGMELLADKKESTADQIRKS
jgi:hypothetical protein